MSELAVHGTRGVRAAGDSITFCSMPEITHTQTPT